MNLREAISEFLIAIEADGVSPATLAWYQSLLSKMSNWLGDHTLESVATNTLRVYIVHLRQHHTDHTVADNMRVMHRFWRWCEREYGLMNPMRNVRYPSLPKTTAPPTIHRDDIVAMFNACGGGVQGIRDRAILAFLLDTGARASGVVTLTIDHLDMQHRTALVSEKGKKSRLVAFHEITAGILGEWLRVRSSVPPVFYNLRTHDAMLPGGLQQLMKRLAKRAGITSRVNPHSWRHTFAREYLARGGHPSSLQILMGHKDVETTLGIYGTYTLTDALETHKRFSPAADILDKPG